MGLIDRCVLGPGLEVLPLEECGLGDSGYFSSNVCAHAKRHSLTRQQLCLTAMRKTYSRSGLALVAVRDCGHCCCESISATKDRCYHLYTFVQPVGCSLIVKMTCFSTKYWYGQIAPLAAASWTLTPRSYTACKTFVGDPLTLSAAPPCGRRAIESKAHVVTNKNLSIHAVSNEALGG